MTTRGFWHVPILLLEGAIPRTLQAEYELRVRKGWKKDFSPGPLHKPTGWERVTGPVSGKRPIRLRHGSERDSALMVTAVANAGRQEGPDRI